jgi:hypothetical protein
VTGAAWLASYPKSGSTWLRLLVANLGANEPVDINDMPEGGGIASARGPFHFHTFIDSGLLTADEADAVRPRVYETMAQEVPVDGDGVSPRLIKAHDAYVMTPLGEPLLAGPCGPGRAVLIVRDPRDVAPSLAHHRHSTVDEAIDFMADRQACFASGARGQNSQLRQRLLDWSGHAASWLDQRDVPVHLVRYEDLKTTPVETFRAAMDFVGRSCTRAAAEKAVDFADFDRLQAQEQASGFIEWRPRNKGELFFRRGENQGWRRELTPSQARRIETAHAPMMARLGYAIDAEVANLRVATGDP